MSFRPAAQLAALMIGAAAILALTGCQTPAVWTPLGATAAVRASGKDGELVGQKTYVIANDWAFEDWVVKSGATIIFRENGTGIFSGRVYTVQPPRWQELHAQAILYGADGNMLFAAPPADLGAFIHGRTVRRDYPVDIRFGFDQRQYPYIERVQFIARVRDADPLKTKQKRYYGRIDSDSRPVLPPAP